MTPEDAKALQLACDRFIRDAENAQTPSSDTKYGKFHTAHELTLSLVHAASRILEDFAEQKTALSKQNDKNIETVRADWKKDAKK